ncbi:YkgJ family cysteine cluster protein [Reyranella sp.]|uniref:YkgJ family cysteine cluster protein n=1 Tax=Reyranella sp. TaxID=1929291 RepID=UPI00122A020F|nr:YkgJ family cysteine cluster protein [Reyranella sp.]TAJ84721.1 MAG: YkgJ family cysteine cluster protein [Reyranella sp.]
MAAEAHSTATLRLSVGDLKVVHPITVPSGSVRAAAVVPALQGLVNAVVTAAETKLGEAGTEISCRKGCGACCRQLLPVSRTEAERLLGVIEAMPAKRLRALKERFATASAAIKAAGLAEKAGRADRELSVGYFALGIPCPFLEEESCSIHPERPLVCREYLVTSPAELCAGPQQDGVTPVPVPKVSMAARGLQDERESWFPLALLLDWAKTRPRDGVKRTGPEWVQRFLKRISSRPG